MERLQKIMAHAGIASRRQSEQMIAQGRVKVNGRLVTVVGEKVDPTCDQIEVDGQSIQIEEKKTFLFYKPRSVITSMDDPQGRKTVKDYFVDVVQRVYPVGRLDFDSEGLLLVSNDGWLTERMTHPRYQVDKQYVATVRGIPSKHAIQQLRSGVPLEDGITQPAQVKLLRKKGESAQLLITIHEGRNRQIRRMCQCIGHPVVRLIRTKIAFLTTDGLKEGSFRAITPTEYQRLKDCLVS